MGRTLCSAVVLEHSGLFAAGTSCCCHAGVLSLSRARIHQTAAKKANFALKWTSKVKTVLKLDLKTFLNLRELDGLRVDSR